MHWYFEAKPPGRNARLRFKVSRAHAEKNWTGSIGIEHGTNVGAVRIKTC